MDTDPIRSFLAVARTGSFTAAARERGFVQSTVTGHVHSLERLLGRRLLDRLPAGSVLTEAGRRLVPIATRFVELEAQMHAELAEGQPVTGTVRIAAPESLCAYRLPTLVARLRSAQPGVRISPVPAGTAAALDALRTGTADLALVLEPTLRAADLQVEPVGLEPVVLVGSASRPPSRTATWEHLAQEEALLLEEGCSYSDDAARRSAAAGQRPALRTRFGSVEAVKHCVAAGLGWTVLPAVAVAREISDGSLRVRPGPRLSAQHVFLARHPARADGAAAACVRALLAELWVDGPPNPGSSDVQQG